MRSRVFILIILILVLIGAIALIFLANQRGGFANLFGGGNGTIVDDVIDGGDDGVPDDGDSIAQIPATPTAAPQFQEVVVSRLDIPVGTMIIDDYLEVEERPVTNIALLGGYTFTDTTALVGSIARVDIARGQEILTPMVTNDPSDVGTLGSDLGLNVPPGQVAIAYPIDEASAVSLGMRPGDLVDFLITTHVVEIDPEFRSELPNKVALVDQAALLDGRSFLFPSFSQGRLEFVTELNQIAFIIPRNTSEQDLTSTRLPKLSTQLLVQQAEVLYVGQYQDPRQLERQQQAAQEAAIQSAGTDNPLPTPTPLPPRLEETPSVVIISVSLQDALALKWAREQAPRVTLTMAMRSPTDNTVYVTNSVSLSQMIDQGVLSIPEPVDFDLDDPTSTGSE